MKQQKSCKKQTESQNTTCQRMSSRRIPSSANLWSTNYLVAAIIAFGILLPYCLQNKDCTVLDSFNVVSVMTSATHKSNCTMSGYLTRSSGALFNLTDPVMCLIIRPEQSFPVCYSAFGESAIQVPPFTPTTMSYVMYGSMLSIFTGILMIISAIVVQIDDRIQRYNLNVIA